MDQGLEVALSAAAKRSAILTTVEATALRRHSPEIEATVYFCCLEALQNALKHAGSGASVIIRLSEDTRALSFDVTDDGAGFECQRGGSGAGFVNMSDRLGAVGGTLQVDSAPGRGTRVAGVLPLTDATHHATDATAPGSIPALIPELGSPSPVRTPHGVGELAATAGERPSA